MSLLEISDVAPPDITPGASGLDKPSVVTATTFDGLTYTLKIGKLVDDKHYVAITIDGDPAKTRTPERERKRKPTRRSATRNIAERRAKLGERLPREKALAAHVLLIDKIKLDDVLQKRSTFLEKKEVKKVSLTESTPGRRVDARSIAIGKSQRRRPASHNGCHRRFRMAQITDRIDNVTRIPADFLKARLPAPKSVKIEISPRCNYRCGFCALRSREVQPKWDMDFDAVQARHARDARGRASRRSACSTSASRS